MISTAVSTYRSTIEPSLDLLIDFVNSRLKSDLHSVNVEGITSRKKSMASIQQKLQAGKVSRIADLRDLAGLTVILLYRHEIPEAIELLKNTDLQIEDPGPIEVQPSNFRYHEPKLFIRPPVSYLERHELAVDVCEVQFTTALQHALDKATHDYDYKGKSYSWSNFRLVAQLRGILEMVDRTIDDIDSVDLADDPTVRTPRAMSDAGALLPVLTSHFKEDMPEDRRRFAETVLEWLNCAGSSASDLDGYLLRHSDLVVARSLDPTSAALGAILREHATELVDHFDGHFLVTSELETLLRRDVSDPTRAQGFLIAIRRVSPQIAPIVGPRTQQQLGSALRAQKPRSMSTRSRTSTRPCPTRSLLRSSMPGRSVLVAQYNPRHDLPLHLRDVLVPQPAVFRLADLVVVGLAANEEGDEVERVEPHHPDAEVAGGQGDGHCLGAAGRVQAILLVREQNEVYAPLRDRLGEGGAQPVGATATRANGPYPSLNRGVRARGGLTRTVCSG